MSIHVSLHESQLRASTKVLEELIQELLYADDCALEAHTLHDIQALTDSFANSASRFGLTINIQKTEVMFQPAPGKAYSDPQVNINGVPLKPVKHDFGFLNIYSETKP